MRRQLIVSFTLIVVLSMLAMSAHCTADKPSVPEFTLKYVDRSYDTEPVYSIDPYTGESVLTDPSYHIINGTIEVTVKNQPFSSFKDSSGNWTTSLYYLLRFKGHYENEWTTFPNRPNHGYVNASSSGYTIISLGHEQLGDISAGDQVDVQMAALIGHDNEFAVFGTFGEGREFFFSGEASEMSGTQTLTIGEPFNQTSEDALFRLDYVTFVLLVIFVLAVALSAFTLYTRKNRKIKP